MKKLLALVFVLIIAAGSSMAANLAVGTSLGFATLRYDFTKDLTGSLGANYFSVGGTSMTGILAKVDYNLPAVNEVRPNVGVYYTTNGAATATTVIGATWGVTTMVQSNLMLGFDVVVANSTSLAGTSTTGILPAAAFTAAYSL